MSLRQTCQKCLQQKPDTHNREYRTEDYSGGCADSFCWASCDSSSCKPQRAVLCDKCFGELNKK
jgi:hypothetical protein